MKIKDFALRFLITFAVAFVANVLVTLSWNYFIKSMGLVVDWESSFRIALLFAIVLPLTQMRKKSE
jgi:hypothetical protein